MLSLAELRGVMLLALTAEPETELHGAPGANLFQ